MAIAISNPLEIGRLGKQTRKAVLVTHIISAGTWIGLDVAMEALQEAWRARRVTMDELWRYATLRRVANVMRPYMESL